MSWHRGFSTKKINQGNPYVSALELHEKTSDVADQEDDAVTNDDAPTPKDVSSTEHRLASSDSETKGPTQPEITTQIWLKTHHPDHKPVKLLPPSSPVKLLPPSETKLVPSPAKKIPMPVSPITSPTVIPAEFGRAERVRDNMLQNMQPPLNSDLQNLYAQRMMKSLLRYDEKQLKQMLVMGVLTPVEEAFLLGRMGWTKDMPLAPDEMSSFRPKAIYPKKTKRQVSMQPLLQNKRAVRALESGWNSGSVGSGNQAPQQPPLDLPLLHALHKGESKRMKDIKKLGRRKVRRMRKPGLVNKKYQLFPGRSGVSLPKMRGWERDGLKMLSDANEVRERSAAYDYQLQQQQIQLAEDLQRNDEKHVQLPSVFMGAPKNNENKGMEFNIELNDDGSINFDADGSASQASLSSALLNNVPREDAVDKAEGSGPSSNKPSQHKAKQSKGRVRSGRDAGRHGTQKATKHKSRAARGVSGPPKSSKARAAKGKAKAKVNGKAKGKAGARKRKKSKTRKKGNKSKPKPKGEAAGQMYECERDCGFRGSFEDVSKHEANCTFEAPPVSEKQTTGGQIQAEGTDKEEEGADQVANAPVINMSRVIAQTKQKKMAGEPPSDEVKVSLAAMRGNDPTSAEATAAGKGDDDEDSDDNFADDDFAEDKDDGGDPTTTDAANPEPEKDPNKLIRAELAALRRGISYRNLKDEAAVAEDGSNSTQADGDNGGGDDDGGVDGDDNGDDGGDDDEFDDEFGDEFSDEDGDDDANKANAEEAQSEGEIDEAEAANKETEERTLANQKAADEAAANQKAEEEAAVNQKDGGGDGDDGGDDNDNGDDDDEFGDEFGDEFSDEDGDDDTEVSPTKTQFEENINEAEAANKETQEEALANTQAEEEVAANMKAADKEAIDQQAEEETAANQKAEEEAAANQKAAKEAAANQKAEEEAAAEQKDGDDDGLNDDDDDGDDDEFDDEFGDEFSDEDDDADKAGAEVSPTKTQSEGNIHEAEAANKETEEEALAKQKAEEEAAASQRAEEEAAASQRAEEEAAAKQKAEEEAAASQRAEEEAAANRKAAEEAAANQRAEEEAAANRKAAEEAAANQKAEEKAAAEQKAAEKAIAEQKAAEEEAANQRAAEEEAANQRAAEEEAANQRAAEEEAANQRAAEEEAANQRAAEEAAATSEDASGDSDDDEEFDDEFANDYSSDDGDDGDKQETEQNLDTAAPALEELDEGPLGELSGSEMLDEQLELSDSTDDKCNHSVPLKVGEEDSDMDEDEEAGGAASAADTNVENKESAQPNSPAASTEKEHDDDDDDGDDDDDDDEEDDEDDEDFDDDDFDDEEFDD